MVDKRIDSTSVTTISNTSYSDTAPFLDRSKFKDFYKVESTTDTGPGDGKETTFQLQEWTTVLAYYEQVLEYASMVDKAGIFAVGQGYSADERTKKILDRIRGNGKENFNFMLYDWTKIFIQGGVCYVEQVRDAAGRLKNLRTLNPGSMKSVADETGTIIRFEQNSSIPGKPNKWEPEEILYFAWNKKGDNWFGTPIIERLEQTVEMMMEAKKDMRIVFHRYVKPLIISHVATDDLTEIATYKAKFEEAMTKSEHMVLPEDVVKNIERVSIPQFSTLDPLPWIKMLERDFLLAMGAPAVVQGQSGDSSESESKILYLSWQQVVKFIQVFIEINFLNQVRLKIDILPPASIAPELTKDTQKDKSKLTKEGVNPKTDA